MESKVPKDGWNAAESSRIARRKKTKALQKEKGRQSKWRKTVRIIRQTVLGFFVTGIVATSIAVGFIWYKYGERITANVNEGYAIASNVKKEDFIQRKPTLIYDKNGKVIKELKQFEYESLPFEDINPYFAKGIVAVEDKRFYLHHGVDLYGTIRGIASTVTGGNTQGGSTITQQLARNVILKDNEVNVERKLKEQVIAQELEKKFSKEEILQYYLNNVYFGHGNYGIGPASRYYFGKQQQDLSVEEVAVIIGITNNPTLFDPITNPKNALSKRNRILQTFLSEGVITPNEYHHAVQKPIELNIQQHTIDNRLNDNDAVNFAVHKATEHLMEANGFVFEYLFDSKNEQEVYNRLYREEYEKIRQQILMGGYEIYTSIDPVFQKELEKTVEDHLSPFTKKRKDGIYETQVAITTVDNETGEVVAIVGGRNQKEDFLNRAYQGVRQPGSAAKPIVAYANAFELGYAPQSQVVDSIIQNGPKNWYKGYWGTMSIRYALEQSVNTVAYKLANQIGKEVFLSKLEKMHFSHLTPEDQNPIIAIGGFTNGVTTVEMAGAYSTFTRKGNFLEPTNIREIKNAATSDILWKNEYNPVPVFQEDAAYMMIDTMKSVVRSGTGKGAAPSNYPYVFGKTGTTNDDKDSYFVGGTPYYTTAVWIGRDLPSTLTSSEVSLSKVLFKNWNTYLHQEKKHIDFEMPDSVYRKGNQLFSKLETFSKRQARREALEEKRLEKEKLMQQERLALEDYRIIHHLTTEEEKRREWETEQAIQRARNFQLTKVEDYEIWLELIAEAETLNQKVKHQRAYENYQVQINELKIIAEVEKEQLIQSLKKQAELEKKREEERKQKEAQIQQWLEELAQWMDRVERGEKMTLEEFQSLEKLVNQLEEEGVPVPTLDTEWIAKTPVEDETDETSDPTTSIPTEPSHQPSEESRFSDQIPDGEGTSSPSGSLESSITPN